MSWGSIPAALGVEGEQLRRTVPPTWRDEGDWTDPPKAVVVSVTDACALPAVIDDVMSAQPADGRIVGPVH